MVVSGNGVVATVVRVFDTTRRALGDAFAAAREEVATVETGLDTAADAAFAGTDVNVRLPATAVTTANAENRRRRTRARTVGPERGAAATMMAPSDEAIRPCCRGIDAVAAAIEVRTG
ncbi:hypothetical protein GCM10011331_20600 [Flavimobilis marinus]|nr:hypothetical protein GCM10011331_20600 [Flavimobilis marinus]